MSKQQRSRLITNIQNVQLWLQLLSKHALSQPCEAIAKRPSMLASRADNLGPNADAVF